jgi:hypothetical protein
LNLSAKNDILHTGNSIGHKLPLLFTNQEENMKLAQNHRSYYFILFIILIFLPVSCKENNSGTEHRQQAAPPTPTEKLQSAKSTPTEQIPRATSTPSVKRQGGVLPQLFKDTAESTKSAPNASHIVRSRYVHINTELLLDKNNQILELKSGTQLGLNLFPDVNFIGVIERIEKNGSDNYSWIGYLQDIEPSRMYIIFTEGVFLAHFASPSGVYEVQSIKNDLYQVVEIDQTKLPQE